MNSRSCPDPEALAAWLDQGVSAEESAQIEAHLAACDDCRLVVALAFETQTAAHESPLAAPAASTAAPARVAHFSRRVSWGVASVLAAAAVVAIALYAPVRWPWRGASIDSKLADLAGAVGNERTVEARLTGGFTYGPLRAEVRSGGSASAWDNWTLLAAAGRIREDAERDPTAENLHALGVAHLVLAEHDEAVRALEDAVAQDPKNARYQTDLAAAYLARARGLDRPGDFPKALGAAERAIEFDDALVEARFNRALALEALFLDDQARAAWEDYLSRDSASGWASEARAHLQKLQQGAAPGDLARNNSPPAITDTSIEGGLDWLLRDGLARWAAAILTGIPDAAIRERLLLSTYAQRLSTASGDRLPSALAEMTAAAADERTLAATLQQFARGMAQLAADDPTAAERELRAACQAPPAPLSLLCDVELAMIDVVHRQDAEALRRTESALTAARAQGYLYVEGRARRTAGYRLLFKGDYAGATAAYGEAFAIFERAKYGPQAANMAAQIADLYELSGLKIDASRWRYAALDAANRVGAANVRLVARLSTASFLARDGEYHASRAFIDAVNADTSASPSPARRLIALVESVRSSLASHDVDTARTELRVASELLSESHDFRVARLYPDLLALRASVASVDGDAQAAEAALTEALRLMGPERPAQRARALLDRAAARVSAGALDSGEQDVEAAIGALRPIASVAQPLQLEAAEPAFQSVGKLVLARPQLQGTTGLLLVEQLRELVDAVPQGMRLESEAALVARLQQLDRATGLVFLFTDHALLTWIVSPTSIEFRERPVDVQAVTRLAAVLSVQVARGAGEDMLKTTLAELYDLLFRSLPQIETLTEALVIPDGPLSRVPFAALFDRERGSYLFERAVLRVAPNLALGVATAATTTPSSVLAVGDPALPNAAASGFSSLTRARHEAYAIAALYPKSTVLVGEHATKTEVLQQLPVAGVLHYAGHAVPAAGTTPARLLLAGAPNDPNNALQSSDLGTGLRGTRVVLAACETATNAAERAAGVTSLAAGFLRAGATSVVATLWPVTDDASSEQFFVSVHRGLAAGMPTPQAVALAQRACYAAESCRRAPATWIGSAAYGFSDNQLRRRPGS